MTKWVKEGREGGMAEKGRKGKGSERKGRERKGKERKGREAGAVGRKEAKDESG